MSGMLLVVGEHDLMNIIQDMPGWRTIQVRYLNEYNGRRYYNIHLTKKQVNELGAAKIKAIYNATEYKPFTERAESGTSADEPRSPETQIP